jgi:hypothetical protein
LLERNAADATPATGCDACSPGRDALTGFGELDVAAAIRSLRLDPLQPRDRLEPNDDVGFIAAVVKGPRARIRATIDSWDDPNDVYRVKLRRGQWIRARLRSSSDLDLSLALWKPATHSLATARDSDRARRSVHPPGVTEGLRYRAKQSGWYFLQVKLAHAGSGPYRLRLRVG